MKNLSNEYLLAKMTDYASATDKERYEAKTEIERRLEAGDRAIQACREIAEMEIEEGK